jgi:hypothetical protein
MTASDGDTTFVSGMKSPKCESSASPIVASARLVEKRGALLRTTRLRFVVQPLDFRESISTHCWPLSLNYTVTMRTRIPGKLFHRRWGPWDTASP